MSLLIDGKKLAAEVRSEVKYEVEVILKQGKPAPGLNLLLVGSDPASEIYVRYKSKDCEQVGIVSTIVRLPDTASEEEVVAIVNLWNEDRKVDGILVQLPLPKQINEQRVLQSINPLKDVDGFHPVNVGKLVIGLPGFVPCTPAGVVEMLRRYDIPTSGKHVVIVGRSNIVGKPLAMLLAQKKLPGNSTVAICHSATEDLESYTKRADILIAAVGSRHLITSKHVKTGAVVIDVGINRYEKPDGTFGLTGDVDFEDVYEKVSAITPVPGGVGPMTRALLLKNTLLAASGVFT
ncbi:MAG: bifunctional methylenetetrahydrofolate dehydrogenase/methenyltetrahydrofolate cyclohydrolase FolD [Ignavibacteria bacterium]|nr:bifunctional methylenetetrahydrofolate dehydrogenase/methenyltetrahydrofolate cyclohydrolase FolD [Ignavibacteria bacterium]